MVAAPGGGTRSFSVSEAGAALTVRTDGAAAGVPAAPSPAGTANLTVFRVGAQGATTAVARFGLKSDAGGLTLTAVGGDPASGRPAGSDQIAADANAPHETFSVGTPQGRGIFGLSYVDGVLIVRPLNAHAASAESIGIDTRMITVTALVVAQQSLKVSPGQVRAAYIVND